MKHACCTFSCVILYIVDCRTCFTVFCQTAWQVHSLSDSCVSVIRSNPCPVWWFTVCRCSSVLPWSVSACVVVTLMTACVCGLQYRRLSSTSYRQTTPQCRRVTSSCSSATSPVYPAPTLRGTGARPSHPPTRWRNAKVRCVRFGVRGKVLHFLQGYAHCSRRRCIRRCLLYCNISSRKTYFIHLPLSV